MIAEAQLTALSPVLLSSFGLRREPPRAPAHREPGYDARFDFDTLFYDVFAAPDGRAVLGIAPPLRNCEPQVAGAVFRRGSGGEPLQHVLRSAQYGSVLRVELGGSAVPEAIRMQIGDREIRVPVRPTGSDVLRGRRVIYTLSKDNPLHWIRDWARYNVRVHGADAAIVYDNGSREYGIDALRDTLASVAGLDTTLVVDWRFPYGPGHGPNREWDSNYCQDRALEHVRARYCANAAAVLNSDIDELVVPLGGRSLFDELAASGQPCLTFAGRWATAVRPMLRPRTSLTRDVATLADLRHTDCLFLEDVPPYLNKWVADPRLCNTDVVWFTHTVEGIHGGAASLPRQPMTRSLEFRHCRQISTHWKHARKWLPRLGRGTRYDRAFAGALATAFPERHVFRASGGRVAGVLDCLRQI